MMFSLMVALTAGCLALSRKRNPRNLDPDIKHRNLLCLQFVETFQSWKFLEIQVKIL